jgi:hypothetical protein
MPPSDAADRLAKSLHPFLSNKVGPAELKALGWFDFLSEDRPETADPIQMALAALLYLSLDEDCSWNAQKAVLTAILAFLHQKTRRAPTSIDLADLRKLLESCPVDQSVVASWFDRVYC